MAIREIPLRNDIGAYSFLIDLDNITFQLELKFNDRTQLWTVDIQNDTGEILVAGIPLYVKQLLLDLYKHDQRLPQGNLFMENLVDGDTPPTRDNIGIDVVLLYEDAA